MADKATTSERPEGTGTSKVKSEAQEAIAASLAALEREAPERTAKRRTVPKVSTDDLFNSIAPRDDATGSKAEPKQDQPAESKAKQPAGSKQTSRSKKAGAQTLFSTGDSAVDDQPVKSAPAPAMTALLFQEPDVAQARTRRRPTSVQAEDIDSTQDETNESTPDEPKDEGEGKSKRRGSRGRRKQPAESQPQESTTDARAEEQDSSEKPEEDVKESQDKDEAREGEQSVTTRRRRRRRSSDPVDEVSAPKGSTRLEAKRQRRKEGREAGRRRHTITESEYLARRESVKRDMVVREQDGLNQIAVLEDDVLVEHYVARHTQVSMVGNVYLGRVQNVLPSMEAAFVDIGKGRNAVLYAGEVNWEAAGMEGKPRKIEQALKSGDTVLVQVTKDPIGHKGARLTAQITLAGRHLVLVPSGAMTGISRKLPEKERQRLKKLLKEIVPAEHGVIVRTAAEGATEEQLRADVERLTQTWADIQEKSKAYKSAPTLLKGEPELAVRVVRDIFNEDFTSLKIQGDGAWKTLSEYVGKLSPELTERLEHWTRSEDIFTANRVDEQLAKAFDRKVWLPSGGTLIVDRTEAMTVIDVNTGKFTGAGGTLEETVTKNNLEAAEEIVRQLRLRDIGGIIVVDFIDMVLEANRELVLRRLIECLGRDRTRHQVAEVTSLGLVQMTRKRVGQGLVEAFSTTCEACDGAGYITHTHPVERADGPSDSGPRRNKKQQQQQAAPEHSSESEAKRDGVKNALNSIAAAAAKGHDEGAEEPAGSGRDDSASEGSSKKGRKPKKGKSGGSKAGASKKGRRKDSGEGRSDSVRSSQENAAGGSTPDSSVQSRAIVKKAAAPIEKPIERPAALRRAANAPVGKVEASSTAAGSAASAGTDAKDAKPKKARRVSSSGTITPGAGASAAIMTFPAQ